MEDRFTVNDAAEMQSCLSTMRESLAEAEKALEKFNRARAQYNAVKDRLANNEEQIDDLVGAVYAGIVGAKKNVQVS